jgi:hypothetical protein
MFTLLARHTHRTKTISLNYCKPSLYKMSFINSSTVKKEQMLEEKTKDEQWQKEVMGCYGATKHSLVNNPKVHRVGTVKDDAVFYEKF